MPDCCNKLMKVEELVCKVLLLNLETDWIASNLNHRAQQAIKHQSSLHGFPLQDVSLQDLITWRGVELCSEITQNNNEKTRSAEDLRERRRDRERRRKKARRKMQEVAEKSSLDPVFVECSKRVDVETAVVIAAPELTKLWRIGSVIRKNWECFDVRKMEA